MRKLAILTFVSLDGVMQAPKLPEEDTSNDFEHGGWADKYWDEVMTQVGEEAMAVPYDLLLGRKTYELFARHNSQDSSPLNPLTKYVVTSSLDELGWQNVIPVSGDLVEEIIKLKSLDGPLLQVHGSWQLIRWLLENDLVDEFRLWSFPVILGKGKRLFSEGSTPNDLKLVKSKPTANGVVMSIYTVKRKGEDRRP